MPRRTAAEARADILQAACAAFLDKGYQDASLDDIASRIGITRGAILYHFSSKEDLLHALTEPVLAAAEQRLAAAEVLDAPTREDRQRYVEAMVDIALQHRSESTLMQRFTTTSSVLNIGPRLLRLTRGSVALLVGRNAAEDAAANVRAAAACAMIVGTANTRTDVPVEPEAERATLVAAAMAALGSQT